MALPTALRDFTARDIMTTSIHTVRPHDPLRKVVALICRYRISGVPVVDQDGYLVGIISERDVLQAMYPDHPELQQRKSRRPPRKQARGDPRDFGKLPAEAIMVRDVITAPPSADALRLASLMASRKIRRIPIVEGKKLVGIVSQGDVYRAIFQGRRLAPSMARSMEQQEAESGEE